MCYICVFGLLEGWHRELYMSALLFKGKGERANLRLWSAFPYIFIYAMVVTEGKRAQFLDTEPIRIIWGTRLVDAWRTGQFPDRFSTQRECEREKSVIELELWNLFPTQNFGLLLRILRYVKRAGWMIIMLLLSVRLSIILAKHSPNLPIITQFWDWYYSTVSSVTSFRFYSNPRPFQCYLYSLVINFIWMKTGYCITYSGVQVQTMESTVTIHLSILLMRDLVSFYVCKGMRYTVVGRQLLRVRFSKKG